jgi:hypothetical protein
MVIGFHRNNFIHEILKVVSDNLYILQHVVFYTIRQTVFTESWNPKEIEIDIIYLDIKSLKP